jgi:hypothetical protein
MTCTSPSTLTADTVPASCFLQVIAGRGQPPVQTSPAAVRVVEDEDDQAVQGALLGR